MEALRSVDFHLLESGLFLLQVRLASRARRDRAKLAPSCETRSTDRLTGGYNLQNASWTHTKLRERLMHMSGLLPLHYS